MGTTLEHTYERFHTTRWTQIRQLQAGDDLQRNEALEALIVRYWPAAYAHLRARGHTRDKAAELTQAFFADVVLERDLFDKARQDRGKLRTFLLTALQRFCVDQHRRRTARGEAVTIPLEALKREEARFGWDQQAESEQAFERRWAVGLFEESLRRCESHFRNTGRTAHWELFEARVLHPAVNRCQPPPLAEAAGPAGFASPALAAAAVQVVKRRASALLREVVAETLDDESAAESELAEVRRYLTD